MSKGTDNPKATPAELLREDRGLLTTLTLIWGTLFLVGVGIYSGVLWWTLNHPLGHGS